MTAVGPLAYCNQCGRGLDKLEVRCPSCGAALDPAAGEGPPTRKVSPHGQARRDWALGRELPHADLPMLVVERGPNVGSRYSLERPSTTVGRDPDSDVFLDDVTVSRDHAVIVRRGSDYHIDDCGSLNGTYVNRQRVESQLLRHGDELQIGKYKLAFLNG